MCPTKQTRAWDNIHLAEHTRYSLLVVAALLVVFFALTTDQWRNVGHFNHLLS